VCARSNAAAEAEQNAKRVIIILPKRKRAENYGSVVPSASVVNRRPISRAASPVQRKRHSAAVPPPVAGGGPRSTHHFIHTQRTTARLSPAPVPYNPDSVFEPSSDSGDKRGLLKFYRVPRPSWRRGLWPRDAAHKTFTVMDMGSKCRA
jgi:hypothetical protein